MLRVHPGRRSTPPIANEPAREGMRTVIDLPVGPDWRLAVGAVLVCCFVATSLAQGADSWISRAREVAPVLSTEADLPNSRSPQMERPDYLRPITAVAYSLGERPAAYPVDYSSQQFSPEMQANLGAVRIWGEQTYSWDTSAFCHRRLFFEDENLERYGRSFGVLQPFVSAGHYTGRLLAWPYLAVASAPCRCVSSAGHELPGSCAPYRLYRPARCIRPCAVP